MWMPTDSRGNNFNDMSMPMLIKVISAAASASGSHVRMVWCMVYGIVPPPPKSVDKTPTHSRRLTSAIGFARHYVHECTHNIYPSDPFRVMYMGACLFL